MTSTPDPVDERLLVAHDLALAALSEITPSSTVGAAVDHLVEADGVVSLRFANTMPGYPGWLWTVSVAVVPDAEPTVLEAELLPAEGALLAPEWVPWAVRLADYQAAQAASDGDADEPDEGEDDSDDDLDDLDDEDDAADDDDQLLRTHAGDVDGVDIDELDEADQDGQDDDSDEDDEADQDEADGDDDSDSDDPAHDEGPHER